MVGGMQWQVFLTVGVLCVASFLCSQSVWEWALLLFGFGVAVFGQVGSRKRRGMRLLDMLQEGVVIVDFEGKILEVNVRGARALKGLKEDVEGTYLFQHLLFRKHDTVFQKLREGGAAQYFCLGTKEVMYDGEMRVLERGRKVVVTFHHGSGNYQKELLGRAFVANASHELRTPITIIRGFAETIHDLPEISEAMLADFSDKIINNCERMDHLVKNLLTLADLDYLPKARLQECDLVGLADSCLQTLLSIHPDIHAECLQNQEEILVNGDPDLLELALMNLLENGVKYSEEKVFISVTVAEFQDRIDLTVTDRGIGIPEEDLSHVFERFFTVNKSHSRRLGGAGLGLSIVSTIIKKHEGRIQVTSEVGKGTSFTLAFQKAMASVP